MEWARGGYLISTDPGRVDLEVVYGYLQRSYWAEGVPREVVEKSIRHSMVFGIYHEGAQVGFARVVTDQATFAYLADVFVLEAHRGQGLGVWLIECVMSHPDLQGLRRFLLATRDAHGLYRRFGFKELHNPARFMEIRDPDPYRKGRT